MSALKLKFLSHGTLEARELESTHQFYEECLGLETIRTSPHSLMIRLGGDNTIAVGAGKGDEVNPNQSKR